MNEIIQQQLLVMSAYHEGAHAVMAHALGSHIYEVTIEGRGYADVGLRIQTSPPLPAEQTKLPRVLYILAGQVGQHIAMDSGVARPGAAAEVVTRSVREGTTTNQANDPDGDIPKLAELMLELFPGDPERAQAYIGEAANRAENLVRQFWPAIRAVADALMGQITVSGDEFRSLVAPWHDAGLLTLSASPYSGVQSS